MIIKSILKKYLIAVEKENLNKVDTLRKKTTRVEVISSLLLVALELGQLSEVEKYKNLLIKQMNMDYSFDEKFYGVDDEDTGAFGAVPTAIALISMARLQQKKREGSLERIIIKIADFLFSQEANGAVQKALLNRSKAYNTDLLVAQALNEVKLLLNKNSIRVRMYNECIRRILLRTLKAQFINGAFPYQTYTYRVPFLYHVMVCAQIKYFSQFYNDPAIFYAFKRGKTFIQKSVLDNNYDIRWERANDHDKRGAVWIYGFLYNVLSPEDSNAIRVLEKIKLAQKNGIFGTSIDRSEKRDIFFSSWLINALLITRVEEFNVDRLLRLKNIIFLKIYLFLSRQKQNFTMTWKYTRKRVVNSIFNTGAHENSDPRN